MIDYSSKRYQKKYSWILDSVFEQTKKFLGQSEKLKVNLYFVSNSKMRKINNQFRQVDRTTDVLSFPFFNLHAGEIISKDKFENSFDKSDDSLLLGEIFISPNIANKQAKAYGHGRNREYAFLFVHGLLHLFGYDHIEKDDEGIMQNLQKIILIKCEVPR